MLSSGTPPLFMRFLATNAFRPGSSISERSGLNAQAGMTRGSLPSGDSMNGFARISVDSMTFSA